MNVFEAFRDTLIFIEVVNRTKETRLPIVMKMVNEVKARLDNPPVSITQKEVEDALPKDSQKSS